MPRSQLACTPVEHTLVLLDDGGRVARSERVGSLPEVAATVGALTAGELHRARFHPPRVVRLDRLRSAELSGEELRLAFLDTLEQRLRLLEQLL